MFPCLTGLREMVCLSFGPAGVWPIKMEEPPHPHPPPAYPSPRQRVDWSRKLCVCFYSSAHKVRAAERAHAGISKGAGRPPSSQRDNTGRRISHRPSHPWLYPATAECFQSCLSGSKAAIVSCLLLCVCVVVGVGVSLRLYVPYCTQEWACLLCLYFD